MKLSHKVCKLKNLHYKFVSYREAVAKVKSTYYILKT